MLLSTLWPNRHVAPLAWLAFLMYLPLQVPAATINFASGTNWDVFNADPATNPGAVRLGSAANTCLDSAATCPVGSTIYGFAGTGWVANLAMIVTANWIWADGITGSTSPADLQEYYFSKTFLLTNPDGGIMWAAADDLVEVRVNGNSVGTRGSITDNLLSAQDSVGVFNIAPFLVTGANIITVRGQNGPAFFGGCPINCNYALNPAGVVFGGAISVPDAEDVHMPEPQSVVLVLSAGLAFLVSKVRRPAR